MKHLAYVMVSTSPAPAGDGDTKSWFEYYKWNGGETFVPVSFPFLSAEEGDLLWFVMDGKVLGGAPILRVETPSLPVQRQELWFNSDDMLELPGSLVLDSGALVEGVFVPSLVDLMLSVSVRRKVSNGPLV